MGFFKPDINKMKTEKDIKGLIKAVKDDEASIRKGAVEALGEIGDKGAVESLVQVLRYDKDKNVRFLAAKALGNTGEVEVVSPLIEALADKDGGIRSGAAQALGRIKDARAVGPLCETLRLEEYSTVRDTTVWALGELKDAKAVETLIWDMQRGGGWYSLGGPQKALASIGEPAVEALIESLRWNDDSIFQSNVVNTLVLMGESATGPLTKALVDENENVRKTAQRALERIKAKKS
jgi:HEAT repeat protein